MCLLFAVLIGLAASSSGQTTSLELGSTIHGGTSDGQIGWYAVGLKAGEYMRVVVTQPLRNAMAELYTPDGEKTLVVDSRNFSKTCLLVWIATTSGEYRIRVSAGGEHEISLEELRPAKPDDRKRVDAERLFLQGLTQSRGFDYNAAVSWYTQALELFRELKEREREADTINALGTAYQGLSQWDQAVRAFDETLEIRRELKDRGGEGAVLNNLGNVYFRLNEYDKAIAYYDQALMIRREVKDRQAEAGSLENLGNAYYHLSQFEKAIDYYQQALVIRQEVKDRVGESQTLNGLANTYNLMSRNDKAVEYWQRALAIAREVKNRPAEGNALNGLGNASVDLSQYEQAIHYFEDALVIRRETRDRGGQAAIFQNRGIAYKRLSQYDKAIADYQNALTIYREVRSREGEAEVLNNIGTAYQMQGQYDRAIPYLEQALAIDREVKDREDEGGSLGNLGESYAKLGQLETATGYFEQALALARETRHREGEGLWLSGLAGVYFQMRRNAEAARTYAQALAIAREIRDRNNEADELASMMEIWQAAGQPGLAVFYGKQAVNTIQSIRADIHGLSRELQQSFLKGNETPYHTLAEILIVQGRLTEAEQVLALLKEEEYFRYIRRDADEASALNRGADMTRDEAEWAKRYREIGDHLMSIGAERGELAARKTLSPEQQQRLEQLERDLMVGNQAFEHFLGELTTHFSAKPEVNAKVVAEIREDEGLMEDLRELPAGTVAIYTLAGEEKFHAILRTPDAQKAYEYPIHAADLNRKVFDFRRAVTDPRIDPRPAAQDLYRILVAPMAEDLRQAKAKTLMWSLDGALRYLPVAALYDGKHYLIEQYRVSVMTLASNARLKDRPDHSWRAAGFGVTKAHDDIEALPEVASEMAGLGRVLPGEIKLDEEFTEASMRSTLLRRYAVVHLASHFRLQPGDESKSFLLLGDGGHLSMAKLKTLPNLFAGVQLLTLSACNTGVGDGTEVEGFGTLAQREGAKAVVASLWPVADESTSLLMQEFYRIRENSRGVTKLEALRESQLKVLRGEVKAKAGADRQRGIVASDRPLAPPFRANPSAPYSHPFFWAPFFLMGNWL